MRIGPNNSSNSDKETSVMKEIAGFQLIWTPLYLRFKTSPLIKNQLKSKILCFHSALITLLIRLHSMRKYMISRMALSILETQLVRSNKEKERYFTLMAVFMRENGKTDKYLDSENYSTLPITSPMQDSGRTDVSMDRDWSSTRKSSLSRTLISPIFQS